MGSALINLLNDCRMIQTSIKTLSNEINQLGFTEQIKAHSENLFKAVIADMVLVNEFFHTLFEAKKNNDLSSINKLLEGEENANQS